MNFRNLISVFEHSAQKNSGQNCFRLVKEGQWTSLTWHEVKASVMAIANGLRKMGFNSGERAAIVAKTRYEWTLCDLGILAAGGVVVPIYDTNTAEETRFILKDSGAKIAFVDDEIQFKKIQSVRSELPDLKKIISFGSDFENLIRPSEPVDDSIYLKQLEALRPEDIASIVYTSGTTGNPKGVVLTHDNFLGEIEDLLKVFSFKSSDESLIFLPLSHILARVFQFVQLTAGFVQCYAESIDKLSENILAVKPHFMVCVPRIFEKMHARICQNLAASSAFKKGLFHWALDIGKKYFRCAQEKRVPSLGLRIENFLARILVFSKIQAKLGGRTRFFVSGGAPLSAEIAEFFFGCGFVILEGYGLTETSAAVAVNHFDAIKIGSVGLGLPSVKFRIAADGEILVRGRQIFKSYFNNEEATEEAIDAEGWFHTGDVGEIDAQGFLSITDRKKDIIVLAAGKKVAPQNIENLLKTDRYLSQVVVHGDRRKFLSALVTLNRVEVENFAHENQIAYQNFDHLSQNERVYNLIKNSIESKNRELAPYQTIKRFAILPHDFSVESGELTPTLKIRRRVIEKRYGTIFDGFYGPDHK